MASAGSNINITLYGKSFQKLLGGNFFVCFLQGKFVAKSNHLLYFYCQEFVFKLV
jgi:hypothetical protein